MSSQTVLKLNTGATIPAVGLGTWDSSDEEAYNSVIAALKTGYRHIDTAAMYRNEVPVGKAINESGVPRSEIFVTTKLWSTQHRNPEAALNASLERMGLDYVDLYLMHWPVALKTDAIKDGNFLTVPETFDGKRSVDLDDWDFVKTWELMQKLVQSGKVKAIGVSNFSINNLKDILKPELKFIVPAVNQIEIHPQLPQEELIEFCHSKGIVVEAYCPLGSSKSSLLSDPEISKIAEKYQAEPAQVLINWGIARGYCVLPKSSNPKRIESNFKTFTLSPEDTQAISAFHEKYGVHRYVDPNWGEFKAFV
ncbi:LAME_0F06524g1_1 [Lachancea meyersii CBS 8951]|uniref:LAME_0F06524g1_1 n=1 Tax=Lachancea meyersii CBS 8951 TaxID=1266667 RepID=A0A1G4JTI6_9SACH|nr:LAME_0F06524g1_1 [Lachancea meyersii CBS 8951]